MNTTRTETLLMNEGNHNKVFHINLFPVGFGTGKASKTDFNVTALWGRRDTKLSERTVNAKPLDLTLANELFDSIKRSKLAKGYKPYQPTQTSTAANTKETKKMTGTKALGGSKSKGSKAKGTTRHQHSAGHKPDPERAAAARRAWETMRSKQWLTENKNGVLASRILSIQKSAKKDR